MKTVLRMVGIRGVFYPSRLFGGVWCWRGNRDAAGRPGDCYPHVVRRGDVYWLNFDPTVGLEII